MRYFKALFADGSDHFIMAKGWSWAVYEGLNYADAHGTKMTELHDLTRE